MKHSSKKIKMLILLLLLVVIGVIVIAKVNENNELKKYASVVGTYKEAFGESTIRVDTSMIFPSTEYFGGDYHYEIKDNKILCTPPNSDEVQYTLNIRDYDGITYLEYVDDYRTEKFYPEAYYDEIIAKETQIANDIIEKYSEEIIGCWSFVHKEKSIGEDPVFTYPDMEKWISFNEDGTCEIIDFGMGTEKDAVQGLTVIDYLETNYEVTMYGNSIAVIDQERYMDPLILIDLDIAKKTDLGDEFETVAYPNEDLEYRNVYKRIDEHKMEEYIKKVKEDNSY